MCLMPRAPHHVDIFFWLLLAAPDLPIPLEPLPDDQRVGATSGLTSGMSMS